MSTEFFAMIRHQNGKPMPLVDENGDIKLFTSRKSAEEAAKKNLMGETFGYEVYEWQYVA